jgi:diguanylate cyclase (GGDEF)-like protein
MENKRSETKKELMEYLDSPEEDRLRHILSHNGELMEDLIGIAENGSEIRSGWFYRFIIHVLTNLEMNEEEARQHYFRILEHKFALSESLNRDIGLRVATLDYFHNICKLFENPKMVELSFFEEIIRMSREDTKTGCFNANFMAEFASKEIRKSERNHQNLSVIIIDIDNFKTINDKYGHLFADQILKKFSELLHESVRTEDLISRFGGDEFVILLPQTGRIGARCLGERVKQHMADYFHEKKHLDEKLSITFSAGIASYPYDASDYEGLVKKADQALYRSKQLGKNRIYDSLENEPAAVENSNFSDKRKFMRYKVESSNDVEIGDKDNLFSVSGKIVNISTGGLLLECSCKISDELLMNNVGLCLKKLGQHSLSNIPLSGNIVRIAKETDRMKFFLALKFEQQIEPSLWSVMENSSELVPC